VKGTGNLEGADGSPEGADIYEGNSFGTQGFDVF
jgi:hypothetical protein